MTNPKVLWKKFIIKFNKENDTTDAEEEIFEESTLNTKKEEVASLFEEFSVEEAASLMKDEINAYEMDPELAALLKLLEGDGSVEQSANDEMDPELAALMKLLEEPVPKEDEMDPELAALLANLEAAVNVNTEPVQTPKSEDEDSMDPELAALLAKLEEPSSEVSNNDDNQEMDPELASAVAADALTEQTVNNSIAESSTLVDPNLHVNQGILCHCDICEKRKNCIYVCKDCFIFK